MVVGHFKMPGRRVCGHSGNGHPAALKIDRCNAAADELRPMQAAAQWRADMACFQSAAGHLGEHGRKEKCVRFADKCDYCRWIRAKPLFETFCCAHARESSA